MPSNPPTTESVDHLDTHSEASSRDNVPYMVYIPVDGEDTCCPIRVSPDAFVADLIEAIAIHRTFNKHVGSQEIRLYKVICPSTVNFLPCLLFKCGELSTSFPGRRAEAQNARYNRTCSWLSEYERSRKLSEVDERDMRPELTLRYYFPSGSYAKEGKIDVIGITDAIRDSFYSTDQDLDLFTLVSSEDNPLRESVSFKLYTADSSSLDWRLVIERNQFNRDRDLPQFVKDIVDMSRSAPDEESDLLLSAIFRLLPRLPERQGEANEFASVFNNLFSEASNATPYVAWNLELAHFAFAAAGIVSPRANGKFTGEEVGRLVLTWFEAFWRNVVVEPDCVYNKSIPFPIVGVVGNGNDMRKWIPRPDATFLEHDVPRFLVEIDSHCKRQDEYRLNVYAACVLRLMEQLRKNGDIKDKNVVAMAVFFGEEWEIVRYLFFMDDENKVCRNRQTFDARNPFQLTHFLREFYNYAFSIKNISTFDGPGPNMKNIAITIGGNIKKSLSTMDRLNDSGGGDKSKGNSRRANHGEKSGSKRSEGLDIRTAMVDALQGSDYALEESDEFAPYIDLPDHIAEARDLKGKQLIVKLVRKRSDEGILLEELSEQKSPLNHAIPLFDTVMSKLGPLLILERGSCLPILWEIHKDKPERLNPERLSRELIQGVAFLHAQKIAHLDIKPDNLICSFDTGRLLIIDFDVAMKCKDVDEMVERSCGTSGWSAPEIVLDADKPRRAFSPIRADLWSCGRVLQNISGMMGKEARNSSFRHLISKLVDREPRHRPLLHEVVNEESVSWTTEQLLQALGCQPDENKVQVTIPGFNRLKRPREDASSGNEGDLVPKLLKEPCAAIARSASSESSSSSDSSFELSSLSDRSDCIEVDIHPDNIRLGRTSPSQFPSQKRASLSL
ncbi:hypothetical protein ACEPAI_1418 [Sanghuangporus weigelae]